MPLGHSLIAQTADDGRIELFRMRLYAPRPPYLNNYQGANKLAPFVSPRKRGIAVPRDRFMTSEYSPPAIKPVKDLRADDLIMRTPGESAYNSSMTGAEREAYWLQLDWTDLDLRLTNQWTREGNDVWPITGDAWPITG